MAKRKRGGVATEEHIIPASSVDARRVQVAVDDSVPSHGRYVKRSHLVYARPSSPDRAPCPEPDGHATDGDTNFGFTAHSAFPSLADIEQYLDVDDADTAKQAGGKKGERTFATLVRRYTCAQNISPSESRYRSTIAFSGHGPTKPTSGWMNYCASKAYAARRPINARAANAMIVKQSIGATTVSRADCGANRAASRSTTTNRFTTSR